MKKGMLFSLITMLMVLVIILSYKISTEKSDEETKLASTQIRIKILNSFITDLEQNYFDDMLKVSSKTALEALANYTAQGKQLNSVNGDGVKPGDFETVMLFGYIENSAGEDCKISLCAEYGVKLSNAQINRFNYSCKLGTQQCQYRKIDSDLTQPVMLRYSFFDLLNKTENVLENLGVRTDSFSITLEPLTQTDNWNINFKAIIDYHFIDNYKIAAWRGRTEKIVNISIIGLEDPIYKKTITKQDWEIDRGPESFCNIEVRCAYSEPSFLSRLEGETSHRSGIDDLLGICPESEDCYET